MKNLLNENLNTLRIANIQSDKREWEEFMQSLYEFHVNKFSEDQLLTEGFLEKVKDIFKKATDNSKKYLQYSFNSFKKNNVKPSEFVKDIGDAFQGSNVTSSKDLKTILKLAKINSLSKGLNEVDEKSIEISSVEEMEKLKPGQKFIWKGKNDRNFPASNFKNLPDGLISDEEYIQAYDKKNDEWIISNTKEAARVENNKDYKSGGFIQKLGDFFRKNKWLTAAMVAPVLASATVGGNAEAMGQLVKAITGSDINIDNSSVLQTGSNPNSMGDDDGDGLTKAGGGDDVTKQVKKVDLGVNGNIDNSDMQDFQDQAKKLMPDEDTNGMSTAATYDVGEYELDQTVKDAAVKKGVRDVLKQIEKQVAETGVSKTITIKGEIKGHISSNAGDEDNVANDGSDLAKGRAATGEEIDKAIQDQVTKIIKDKLGVDVKFDTKSTSDSNIEGQVQHKAVDGTADQSTTIKYKAETDGGKKIGSIKNWQPVVAVTGKGGSDMGQRVDVPGKTSEKGNKREKPTDATKANNPDIQRVADRIKNNTTIQTRIGNINNEVELETLLLALVGTVNPTFQTSTGGSLVNKGLTMASNQIKEANIPTDVQNIIKILNQDPNLIKLLNNVNNEKEWTELLVRIIVPLLPPDFRQNKKAIKSAFFRARNKWQKIFIEWEKQKKDKSPEEKNDSQPIEDPSTIQKQKSLSPWNTTTTGGNVNIMYTLKEIRRLQKLAGVIK